MKGICNQNTISKGEVTMTKEQVLKWLEQYSDEEVHIIFAELLQIKRTGLSAKAHRETTLKE